MQQTSIKHGLVAGVFILIYSTIVDLMTGSLANASIAQFQKLEQLGFLRYLILILAVFILLRTLKNNSGEPLPFMTLVKHGVILSLIVAAMIGIWELIFIVRHPDFYSIYSKIYIDQVRANGATEQVIQTAQKNMAKYTWMQNPPLTGLFYFLEYAALGASSALIFGLFLGKRKTNTDEE